MLLNPEYRESLIEAIQSAFSEITFPQFTLNKPIGLTYSQTSSIYLDFPSGLGAYVDRLTGIGKLHRLINALVQENGDNDKIKTIATQFYEFYTIVNGEPKIRTEQFTRQVVNNKSVLFIGREEFSQSLCKMVNKDIACVIGLKGERQTGISHVHWYLSDLQVDMKCFQFTKLNLNEIGRRHPEDSVSAEHLAEIICIDLNIPFTGLKDFKMVPFLDLFRRILREMEAKGEKWLFFIDQFDYPHKNEVKILVQEMARIILEHPNTFYLVFSLYKDWEKEWDPVYADLVETVEFLSFSPSEVAAYLENLYQSQRVNIKVNMDRKAYLESLEGRLSTLHYNSSSGSNVPVISRELKDWYKDLKKKIVI
jgi:hypothetical protein